MLLLLFEYYKKQCAAIVLFFMIVNQNRKKLDIIIMTRLCIDAVVIKILEIMFLLYNIITDMDSF